MKTRNRKALLDVTPGNTPQSKRTARATVTLKEQLLGTSKRLPALDIHAAAGGDEEDVLPQLSALPVQHLPSNIATSSVLPLQSTPLGSRTRVIHSVKKPTTVDTRQQFSPLPPSSPPSISSYDEDAENRPPPEPHYKEDAEDENNRGVDEPVTNQEQDTALAQAQVSSDDPFGFNALEKRLKLQREMRRRSALRVVPMPVQKEKGKGIARHRAPLGELEVPPVASTSVALTSRAPTPYNPSDDLDDMYLDPREMQSTEAQVGHHGHDEYHTEQEKNAFPLEPEQGPVEHSDDDYEDPTVTPHPQHVANIIPEAWPVSSREGTPCDRSLPDSLPSSPSPVKPLTVPRPLPVAGSSTVKKQQQGKLAAARVFPSSTPIPTPLPAARKTRLGALASSSGRLRDSKRVKGTGPMETADEQEEDPMAISRNLEKLLPKRHARHDAPPATPLDTSSPTRTVRSRTDQGKGKGKGRSQMKMREYAGKDEDGSDGESGRSEDERSLVSSPLAKGKRKASKRKTFPVKRRRVEVVITKRPPKLSSSSARTKPPSRARDKVKGTSKASPQKVGDEDSVRVPHLRD
jgi:hypothetical protein